MKYSLSSRVEHTQLPKSGGKTVVEVSIQPEEAFVAERPLHVVFCVDSSSSMNFGNRIGMIKDGLPVATEHLSGDDKLGIVEFADDASVALEPVSGSDRERVEDALSDLVGNRETNLIDGLATSRRLHDEMSEDSSADNRPVKVVVLLTDGAPSTYTRNVFPEVSDDLFKGIDDDTVDDVRLHGAAGASLYEEGITVHAGGVGNYSFDVIDAIVTNSGGSWHHLDSSTEIEYFFKEIVQDVNRIVATNPVLELTARNGAVIEDIVQKIPHVGHPHVERHGDRYIIHGADIHADKPPEYTFEVSVPDQDPGLKTIVDASLSIESDQITDSVDVKFVPNAIRDPDAGVRRVREEYREATGIESDTGEKCSIESAEGVAITL